MDLTQSWLYAKLASIFGEDELSTEFEEADFTSEYWYYPVKDGIELLGWVGIKKSGHKVEVDQLVNTIAEHQQLFRREVENREERLWQKCIEQEQSTWLSEFQQLGYAPENDFVHIYVHTNERLEDVDFDLYAALKEIMERVMEEPSFFLKLNGQTYVWILPHFTSIKNDLESMLKGLVDTITSECMMDVLFYVGEAHKMPIELRKFVEQERNWMQLAVRYTGDEHIVRYRDLIPKLLMSGTSVEELQIVVERVLAELEHDPEMLHTIDVFFEQNLNVSEAAKVLYIHRNSLQYRLEKFIEKTGFDVRSFEDAVRVYLAMIALGMIHK